MFVPHTQKQAPSIAVMRICEVSGRHVNAQKGSTAFKTPYRQQHMLEAVNFNGREEPHASMVVDDIAAGFKRTSITLVTSANLMTVLLLRLQILLGL